jgi:hypothetical protein
VTPPKETHQIEIPVSDEIIQHAKRNADSEEHVRPLIWDYINLECDFGLED